MKTFGFRIVLVAWTLGAMALGETAAQSSHDKESQAHYQVEAPKEGGLLSETRLFKLLRDSKNTTMERLLYALPVAYRKNYALVYASQSLQGATFTSPRVIFFGESANVMLAFHDDPKLPGHKALEIIAYDETKRVYRFYEASYSPDGKSTPKIEPEPERCRNCHGNPAHPLWGSYFFWPGVYGSEDDQFARNHDAAFSQPTLEEKGYLAFVRRWRVERANQHGRYGALEPQDAGYLAEVRPNLQLNILLHAQNMRWITKRLQKQDSLRPLRYAIAAAIEQCRIDTFFPEDLQGRVNQALDRLEKNTSDVSIAGEREKLARNRALTGSDPRFRQTTSPESNAKKYGKEIIPGLRFLVEGFSPEKIIDWSNEAFPKSYRFDLSQELYDLRFPFRQAFFNETELHETIPLRERELCDYFKEKHQKAFPPSPENRGRLLQALKRLEDLPAADPNAPFGRCVSCHSGTNNAPVIPFGDRAEIMRRVAADPAFLERLRDRISEKPASGKSPMPPDGSLGADEREAIRVFLRQSVR